MSWNGHQPRGGVVVDVAWRAARLLSGAAFDKKGNRGSRVGCVNSILKLCSTLPRLTCIFYLMVMLDAAKTYTVKRLHSDEQHT